jgi:hypothetical protein
MSPTQRRTLVLISALALVMVAGCDMTQTAGSDGPTPSGTMFGFEPSESEEPSVPAPPPASEDVAGTWEGTWVIDGYGNTGDFTMELTPSGDGFTGPIESTNTDCPMGTVNLMLDGSSVTMGWVLAGVTVDFTGTKSGDSMSGTWSAPACSDGNIFLTGTWEATKR